jgi:hypothetical protein
LVKIGQKVLKDSPLRTDRIIKLLKETVFKRNLGGWNQKTFGGLYDHGTTQVSNFFSGTCQEITFKDGSIKKKKGGLKRLSSAKVMIMRHQVASFYDQYIAKGLTVAEVEFAKAKKADRHLFTESENKVLMAVLVKHGKSQPPSKAEVESLHKSMPTISTHKIRKWFYNQIGRLNENMNKDTNSEKCVDANIQERTNDEGDNCPEPEHVVL